MYLSHSIKPTPASVQDPLSADSAGNQSRRLSEASSSTQGPVEMLPSQATLKKWRQLPAHLNALLPAGMKKMQRAAEASLPTSRGAAGSLDSCEPSTPRNQSTAQRMLSRMQGVTSEIKRFKSESAARQALKEQEKRYLTLRLNLVSDTDSSIPPEFELALDKYYEAEAETKAETVSLKLQVLEKLNSALVQEIDRRATARISAPGAEAASKPREYTAAASGIALSETSSIYDDNGAACSETSTLYDSAVDTPSTPYNGKTAGNDAASIAPSELALALETLEALEALRKQINDFH